MVKNQILGQNVSQMRCTEDNEAIQTLVLDALHKVFSNCILIGGAHAEGFTRTPSETRTERTLECCPDTILVVINGIQSAYGMISRRKMRASERKVRRASHTGRVWNNGLYLLVGNCLEMLMRRNVREALD